MQWDVGLGRAVAHTLWISGGAALLASAMAAIVSYGIYFARIPLARAWAAWIGGMLLIPVYVQATAWSAGFGIQGWLRLSQVDAAKHPWWGIASVIWIHAVAAFPACFLILSHGWHRIRNATYEQAWSEFGPAYVATRIVPVYLAPWWLASFLWTFCTTQNDMVVSNLFQVPTLCESVYQQVQFGKLRSGPIALSWCIPVVCGAVAALSLYRLLLRSVAEPPASPGNWDPVIGRSPGATAILSILVAGILGITIVVPWLGMLVRIGMGSRMVDGRAERGWSVSEFLSGMWHVLDYRIEIGWSLALVMWTTLATMLMAIALAWWVPFRRGSVVVVGVMVFLLALPGPIVNLAVSWFVNHALPTSLQFLGDQTLLGPIVALQARCLPIAYGILWLARWRFETQHAALLPMDASLPEWVRLWIWIRHAQSALIASALASALIAMGDLASYLLVQPPGVTTVAMRMFELLHYGIRNREASLALVLSAFAALPSWWLARWIAPAASHSRSNPTTMCVLVFLCVWAILEEPERGFESSHHLVSPSRVRNESVDRCPGKDAVHEVLAHFRHA